MKRSFPLFILAVLVSSMLLVSGCGTSKASSTGSTTSSKQTATSNASDQPQSSARTAAVPMDSSTKSGPESMSVSWVDAKSDILSPSDGQLDGITDGHFQLTMQLPQPVLIESIFIRYSEFGKELRWDWIYNNHLTPAGYNLGVYEKGNLVSPAADTGLKRSGQVVFELFAAGLNNANGKDTLSFDSGSNFQVEVNYTSQAGERKQWSTSLKSQ